MIFEEVKEVEEICLLPWIQMFWHENYLGSFMESLHNPNKVRRDTGFQHGKSPDYLNNFIYFSFDGSLQFYSHHWRHGPPVLIHTEELENWDIFSWHQSNVNWKLHKNNWENLLILQNFQILPDILI